MTCYHQAYKTVNSQNIFGMFIVLLPITNVILKLQKMNGFLSIMEQLNIIILFLALSQKIPFLLESCMHYGSEKCQRGFTL